MKILSKWISISARNGRIFYNRKLARLGLKSGEFLFVLCINDHPGFTQDQLAEELSINKSTVARAVAELIDKGFVYRESNAKESVFIIFILLQRQRRLALKLLVHWRSGILFLSKAFLHKKFKWSITYLLKISENAQKYAR